MKSFKNILAKPSRESQPWAVWIWNLSITKDEVTSQLKAFIDKGFGGIAIRPGRDMTPTYLSEEFFALFETALTIAQEHGIAVRIADDFSLPWSGAFTSYVQQSRQYRAHYLTLKESVDLPAKADFERNIEDIEDTVVLAMKTKDHLINLTDVKVIPVKKHLSWKPTTGDWKVCVFKKEYIHDLADGFVPNVFNTKVAQTYIQTVLEPLKTHFTKFIPGTFEGFINEMPAYRPSGNAIPWDDDLILKYRGKYKKDLLKLIPALFFESDTPVPRIRAQIYEFIYQSMFERFASPLETWAKKYRLSQWVLSPERGIHSSATMLVDGMVPREQPLTSVGIQNQNGTDENFPLLRIAADASINEFKRETITVIGRNRQGTAGTIQSLKSEIDQNILNGSSRTLIDGFFFNIDQRSYLKTPYNPAWYTPGWEHMKHLCDYSSRAQETINGIQYNRQVAVFTPTPGILGMYRPDSSEISQKGMEQLKKTLAELSRLNVDYDIVSEEQLLLSTIRNSGEFATLDRNRKGAYQALVVPYAPVVSRSALVFLEKLSSKQGTIVFVDEAPRGTLEDGLNASVAARIDKLIGSKRANTKLVPISGIEQVIANCKPTISVKVSGKSCTDISCSHGSAEGHELYVITNLSEKQDHVAIVEIPADKHLTSIDCDHGEMHEIEEVERDGQICRFSLYIGTKRTFYIVASPTKIIEKGHGHTFRHGINPFALSTRNYRIVLKDQWAFEATSLNVLPLSNWNVRIGLSRESGGFSHFYESSFQTKILPSQCYFVMNGIAGQHKLTDDNNLEVCVNGTRVDRPAPIPVSETGNPEKHSAAFPVANQLDPSIRKLFGLQANAYQLKDLLIRGFNRVSLRTTGFVSAPQTILYPPVIIGNFSISKGSNGYAIDKPSGIASHDSWTKHGYPYLTGSGVYKQSFEIPNEYERLVLRVSQVSGSVDLKLNDKPLGLFHWHPIEIDVTSICESKRNEVVITVFNSFDNILRLNGRPSGLVGEVFLDVY